MIGNCYNNILQDYYTPKRALIKNGDVNASKNRKFAENNGQYESEKENMGENVDNQSKEDKKNAYFLRILHKKNKLRSQFNMNIHNSIYTFKQFMKACQSAQPKPVDMRLSPEN